MSHFIFAAIYRETFGQGTSELAGSEAYLVMFLLGLLSGVFLLGAFLVWHNLRTKKEAELPADALELMDEVHSGASDIEDSRSAKESPSWEKEADWWKDSS